MKLHPIKSVEEMAQEIEDRIKNSGRPGHILALLVIVGVIVAVTVAMKYFGPSLGLQPGSGLP